MERVSIGAVRDPSRELVGCVALELRDLGDDVGDVQWPELDPRPDEATVQLRQHGSERMPAMELVGPIRGDEDHLARPNPAGEEQERGPGSTGPPRWRSSIITTRSYGPEAATRRSWISRNRLMRAVALPETGLVARAGQDRSETIGAGTQGRIGSQGIENLEHGREREVAVADLEARATDDVDGSGWHLAGRGKPRPT